MSESEDTPLIQAVGYVAQLSDKPVRNRPKKLPFGFQAPPPAGTSGSVPEDK